jgi:hypothetical protein
MKKQPPAVDKFKASPEMIMEAFVEAIDEMAGEQGFTKAEFARAVWPESTPRVASYRWQSMRNKVRNTGKPQGVLISDAFRMCAALNQALPYVFILAEHQAIQKQPETEGPKTAPAKGRKKKPDSE